MFGNLEIKFSFVFNHYGDIQLFESSREGDDEILIELPYKEMENSAKSIVYHFFIGQVFVCQKFGYHQEFAIPQQSSVIDIDGEPAIPRKCVETPVNSLLVFFRNL